MKNKSTIITFIVSFLIVGSLIALFSWKSEPPAATPTPSPVAPSETPEPSAPVDNTQTTGDDTVPLPSPTTPPRTYDFSNMQNSPEGLKGGVTGILTGDDKEMFDAMVAQGILSSSTLDRIREFRNNNKLNQATVTEIGTWNSGKNIRYKLTFDTGETGIVDIEQGDDNLWRIQSIDLASKNTPLAVLMQDSLGVTQQFVQAVLASDFNTACSLVDPSLVSNATIAGLCILFEEGNYSLRDRLPIKGSFINDANAGFLINLTGKNNSAAQMGVTLKKTGETKWLVSEVALDSLLSSFVKNVAEDEEIYVPLVKNPKGGDSLVLFFGFNEDILTPRSLKQLAIVAQIFKINEDRKLEISGHTDDIGGERYNQDLSERRANAVKAALVAEGVPEQNIVTQGYGKTLPRRSFGSDDPEIKRDEARRVNRRAEMYLDF